MTVTTVLVGYALPLAILSVIAWLSGALAIRTVDHVAGPWVDGQLGWTGSLKAGAGTMVAWWILASVVYTARWLA